MIAGLKDITAGSRKKNARDCIGPRMKRSRSMVKSESNKGIALKS